MAAVLVAAAPLVEALVSGLLMDLSTIVSRLEAEVRDGPSLDSFLLAAGAGQITDDYLHSSGYPWDAVSGGLVRHPARAARTAGQVSSAVLGAAQAARTRRPARRRVLHWRWLLGSVIDELALAQIEPGSREIDPVRLARRSEALGRALDGLPVGHRRAVVRLPACFQRFDLRPADVLTLARRFTAQGTAQDVALLVVGVRTSGSYLAPLCAAALRALGRRRVGVLTARPGQRLWPDERARVARLASAGGVALVVDDPPVSGASVDAVARQLERAGLAPDSITLLLPAFGSAVPPAALRRYAAVVLPAREWSVAADLESAAVRRALNAHLGPHSEALAVERRALPSAAPERDHFRRRFRVRIRDGGGEPAEREVLVEGVGLGYLGAHRIASQVLVERYSAGVLGFGDGLLYREWLPDAQRIEEVPPPEEDALANAIAAYATDRRRALPVPADLSLRLAGEQPAWEVGSRIVSQAFGRGGPLARVLLTDRAVKRVLAVRTPSVVDGNTDLRHWFRRNGSAADVVKPDVGEDRFSNLCPPCFDAAFDLAGVTARAGSSSLAAKLRRAFAELDGEAIGAERWLLYELIHLWARERTQPEQDTELRRGRARILQRYFADVYLEGVTAAAHGPLCAFDIDGVLESDLVGCSALTPSAALSLRALLAHGYRPVLASGRSLSEVAERCRAYGLAGGVAEYGGVIFESGSGLVRTLLSGPAAAQLTTVRMRLGRMRAVAIDDDHRQSVRAFVLADGRRRAPLPDAMVAEALDALDDPRPVVIPGEGQTDFVAGDVDKAIGLRALAGTLGVEGERPFALAVGDRAPDLSIASLAGRACAPRHSEPVLGRGGFEVMARPYQAGLAQAVGELLGHEPGRCPACEMPPGGRDRAILRALLAARERGPLGMVVRALELGWCSR